MFQKPSGIATYFGAAALSAWLAACNSSEFGGTSAREATSGNKTKNGGDDNGDDDGGDDGGDDHDADAQGGGNDGAGGGSDGESPGNSADVSEEAAGGSLITESEASCLLQKGDDFRILFVLDNSGSTRASDPRNIRQQAAMRLIDQFTDFVKANPKVTFKTAAIGFHRDATPGSHGWVELSDTTRQDIEADINAATTNPGAGTRFDEAMAAAERMFGQDNASATEKKQRTYMILLSDGQANGSADEVQDILPLVTNLAQSRGVAVYSILIGFNLLGIGGGAQMMQGIAVPATGIVGPDHVGNYVEAPDASAIDQAFTSFFAKVTSC